MPLRVKARHKTQTATQLLEPHFLSLTGLAVLGLQHTGSDLIVIGFDCCWLDLVYKLLASCADVTLQRSLSCTRLWRRCTHNCHCDCAGPIMILEAWHSNRLLGHHCQHRLLLA